MTFAEADAQYELIKQRYQAGELTDEQYDDQLRKLMVLDELGRWWAKSRENGAWHFYDAVTESWMPNSPPTAGQDASKVPLASTSPASTPASPSPADPATAQTYVGPTARTSGAASPVPGSSALPKWAAVAPASVQRQAAAKGAPVGPSAPPAGPAAGGYSARDFGPVSELSGSLKVVFYVLSLLVPVLGFALFFVYRKKPAQADRSAARVFLILGVVSLIFTCLGTVAIYLIESVLLGTRALA